LFHLEVAFTAWMIFRVRLEDVIVYLRVRGGGSIGFVKLFFKSSCFLRPYAAMNNHLDCLCYAHENRAPWDSLTRDVWYVLRYTIKNKRTHLVRAQIFSTY